MFPQIRYSFQNCDRLKEKCIENPTYGYKVLLTLILSTKLAGSDWKTEALKKASNILSSNPEFSQRGDAAYLNSLVKLRMAEVSRRLQGVHFSDLGDIDPPADPRSNSLEGAWRQFEAQERIMMTRPDLHGAATILKDFTSWDPMAPSTSERHVLNQLRLCQGKIQRWCAEFELASATFSGLEDDIGAYYDDTGCTFWSHYIGTLCELHKFKNAEHWARHAVRGYERLYEQGVYPERQKRHRTLRLSLAEVLTCKCLAERATASRRTADVCTTLGEAEVIYKGLDREYGALSKRDWATHFEHLRVHIGKALTAYLVGDRFEESQQLWQDVLDPARYCEDHDKITGFVQMIINYSLCDIASKLGDMDRAHTHLRIAKTLFSKVGREHWWTCMGTTMLDLLAKSLDEANLVSGITRSIL